MKLSAEQTRSLLESVAAVKPDELDCDGCFEHLAEFVELELTGAEIPEALAKVRRHIAQCPCCKDEHNALLDSLRALDSEQA